MCKPTLKRAQLTRRLFLYHFSSGGFFVSRGPQFHHVDINRNARCRRLVLGPLTVPGATPETRHAGDAPYTGNIAPQQLSLPSPRGVLELKYSGWIPASLASAYPECDDILRNSMPNSHVNSTSQIGGTGRVPSWVEFIKLRSIWKDVLMAR